jgi:NAD(P)H-hydrate epimerase
MKVSRVKEMQHLDKTAMETYGISEALLMENAGLSVSHVINQTSGMKGKRFILLCGTGNNGGDGFVVARKIHSNGGQAKVILLGDPGRYAGAARMNLKILENLPVDLQPFTSRDALQLDLTLCDAIVDAIFGTGLTRPVDGLFREAIELVNASGKTVYSVDIPSGISGDTGQVQGLAVHANHTITFGLPKTGNFLYPGFSHCGTLHVSHISFPPNLYKDVLVSINAPPELPRRNPDGHKGSFGQGLSIAGAFGYFGAPLFSAMAFLRAGGGYSRLACPKSMVPFLAREGRELVFIPLEETSAGALVLANKDKLLALCEKMDAVVLGPGLSLQDETLELVRQLAFAIEKPLVLDGDGITALCEDPDILSGRKNGTILTPHMGEMARLTGKTLAEIQENKIDLVQRTAKTLNAVMVLKGAHSLIGCPDGRVFINLSGNSGMATAGSGDVLSGTIGAMVAMGLPLEDAARKGVFLHGLAGDLAALEKGEDGLTAGDILEALPLALKLDREGLPKPLQERYRGPFPVL